MGIFNHLWTIFIKVGIMEQDGSKVLGATGVFMKRQKDDNRIVFQSLAMIMQFGLNMLVPICMMSALGIWLDKKLGTSWITIILFLVGAVAGGQNIYQMAKRICDTSDTREEPGQQNKIIDKKGDSCENNRDTEKGE